MQKWCPPSASVVPMGGNARDFCNTCPALKFYPCNNFALNSLPVFRSGNGAWAACQKCSELCRVMSRVARDEDLNDECRAEAAIALVPSDQWFLHRGILDIFCSCLMVRLTSFDKPPRRPRGVVAAGL
jgi:hypothetical protein